MIQCTKLRNDELQCYYRALIRIRARSVPRISFYDDELRFVYALLRRFTAVDGAQLPPVVVMISVGVADRSVLHGVWISAAEGNNGVAHVVRATLDSVKCIRRPPCYLNGGLFKLPESGDQS